MTRASVLLLLCAAALAGPSQELAKLEEARNGSKKGFVAKYEEFKPLFVAFASKHPGTDAALTAKLWLLQQAWWLYKDKPAMHTEAALWADDILKNHARSPRIGEIVLSHFVFSPDQKKKYFGVLLESRHAAAKAAAHFGLGRELGRKSPEEAKNHFGTLAEKYAEIPYRKTTYGAMAQAYLNKHDRTNLTMGKPAPEIVGVDHRGKPMKLSAFRGKVVLLDFWGDW